MLRLEQATPLFKRALMEFAPEWEVTEASEVTLANPDAWQSGLGTFGFVIESRSTRAIKILGRRNGPEPNATFHRGVSFRVLEAYEGGFREPIKRYLDEIRAVKEATVNVTAKATSSPQPSNRHVLYASPANGGRAKADDVSAVRLSTMPSASYQDGGARKSDINHAGHEPALGNEVLPNAVPNAASPIVDALRQDSLPDEAPPTSSTDLNVAGGLQHETPPRDDNGVGLGHETARADFESELADFGLKFPADGELSAEWKAFLEKAQRKDPTKA